MIADPVDALLYELACGGIELRAQGDVLRFRPADAVPPDVLERMRRHKDALLERLRQEAEVASGADWSGCARNLIETFDDADLRSDLTDVFEEVAAQRAFDDQLPSEEAEMLAFGQLVADILRRGLQVPVVSP